MSADRSYYLTDFADEVSPVNDATLPSWAAWLSKPDADWGRDAATSDGATFAASVTRWLPDIIATRSADGWTLSRDPAGLDFAAVRFGPGLGWNAENILDECSRDAFLAWFRENDAICDDVEYIAAGISEPDVLLTYRAGPPATLVAETVQ